MNVATKAESVYFSVKGQVVIPRRLRKEFEIEEGTRAYVEATPEGILLRPAVTLPIEMYSAARVKEFDSAEADLAAALAGKSTKRTSVKTPVRKAGRSR